MLTLIKKLSDNFINFKQLIFLYSLVNNNKSLFDKYNKSDPIDNSDLFYLSDNDLIIINLSDDGSIYFSKCIATENSINLIKEFEPLINNNVIKDNNSNNTFIDTWYDLWPKGIKSGGYYIKTDKKTCEKNLNKFLKTHPEITEEIILKATKKYLDDMKDKNYHMCKLAPYFIYKDGLSMLEGFCSNIGEDFVEDDPFVNKV